MMEGLGSESLVALERPRSLSTPVRPTSAPSASNNNSSAAQDRAACRMSSTSGQSGVGLLSPLEEAEEWARINDIMQSFGGGITRESVFMAELEQEFQAKLGLSLSPSQQGLGLMGTSTSSSSLVSSAGGQSLGLGAGVSVGVWLSHLGFPQYEDVFLTSGYDNTEFMSGGLLEEPDLLEIGISNPDHIAILLEAISQLPSSLPPSNNSFSLADNVEDWLKSINLTDYAESFKKNGFGEMERVKKIWEIELTTVLEVTKLGHKKRILLSLGNRPIEPELPSLDPHDLSLELNKLNTDISQLKEQLFNDLPSSVSRERRPPETATNTMRRVGTKKRSAPQPPAKAPRTQPSLDQNEDLGKLTIREPSQLVVGVPNTLLTSWRHQPDELVTSSVQYMAQYLGSTHVKELKGTESTMKSIQKMKKATAEGSKVPRIVLSVSFRGVKFIDATSQVLICEHEIRNIHCACQDADDLSHFAYITKDMETKGHYCHVFRVQSRDLATEIILTLGEAFEVAYQLALRDHTITNQSDEQKLAQGHTRSRSEHVRSNTRPVANGQHTRSHSNVTPPTASTPPSVSTPPTTSTLGGGMGGVSSSSAENLLTDSGNVSDKEGRRGTRSGSLGSRPQVNGT